MPPNAPTSCTKTAIVNNGLFSNAATWSPAGVPSVDDIVCIPAGITVLVKNPVYTNLTTPCTTTYTNTPATPRLAIFICGILDFESSGKLNLGCGSVIQVFAPTGLIRAANGNSDQIKIGDRIVWGGSNNDVPGPAYINLCPTPNQNGNCVSNGVLSVQLKTFEAKLNTPFEASIRWSTSSEVNSKEFILEKSTDASKWVVLQSIAAKGNSNSESYYSIVDKQLSNGANFYRLKQVDLDEKAVYSEIVTILNKTKNKIAVYPNPAVSNTTLYTSDVLGRNQIVQLYNINGAFIQNLNPTSSNVLHFGTGHLSPGLYLIRIVENGKTIAETKLIKQ